MQSAADAAATAGANRLVKGDEAPLSDYTYTTFISNSDEGLLQQIAANKKISATERDISKGNEMAKEYAQKEI